MQYSYKDFMAFISRITKFVKVPIFECKDIKCVVEDEGFLGAGSFGVVRAGFHDVFGTIAAKCIRYTGRNIDKNKFLEKSV